MDGEGDVLKVDPQKVKFAEYLRKLAEDLELGRVEFRAKISEKFMGIGSVSRISRYHLILSWAPSMGFVHSDVVMEKANQILLS